MKKIDFEGSFKIWNWKLPDLGMDGSEDRGFHFRLHTIEQTPKADPELKKSLKYNCVIGWHKKIGNFCCKKTKVAEIFNEIMRLMQTTKQIVQVIHKLHFVKEPKKPDKTQ